ncbi:MAG: biotin/lipoyl-containing protein [Planctomycetota bacterium]
MIHKVRMPRVDANVDQATIGRWYVDEGEDVAAGDKVVEILTDKADFEVESEVGGKVRKILAPEKSVLPVGYIIGLISEDPSESLPDVDEENGRIMREYREDMFSTSEGDNARSDDQRGEPAARKKENTEAGRVRATPSARRAARNNGVELREVSAETDGVIREDDVIEYLKDRPT